MARRPSLGKGLDELLTNTVPSLDQGTSGLATSQLVELQLSQISHNEAQPRQTFNEVHLTELAQSIKSQGVVQPLIVRPIDRGYQLVAGERRWRAAQMAGLTTVPVIIREVDDSDSLVIALIENLQREDLNPIEEAKALQRLYEDFGYKQGEIGGVIGKSRAAVNNLIRLLNLDQSILDLVAQGELEEGHARALLGLNHPGKRKHLAEEAVDQKLTVRQLEEQVRRLNTSTKAKPSTPPDQDLLILERELTDKLGAAVRIKQSKRGKTGALTVYYKSLDKLDEILKLLRSQ